MTTRITSIWEKYTETKANHLKVQYIVFYRIKKGEFSIILLFGVHFDQLLHIKISQIVSDPIYFRAQAVKKYTNAHHE